MHLVQLTEHQHNLYAKNERFNISARDSPLKAPWFDTSTWERKEASSFDDDLAMSVGLATSVWSYREPFR